MPKDARADYNWFIKKDLSYYKGKYVAIAGQKIVSSGYDAKEVYEKALKKTLKIQPTLAKIPSEDVMVLIIA